MTSEVDTMIDRKFASFNLKIQKITPDGNCLFRAISHQLYNTETYHEMIRKECMDYIVKEKEHFQHFISSQSFEDYVERMRQDKTWGDHIELQAISEIYKARIEIFYNSEIPIVIYYSQGKPERIIRLYYRNLNHYDSIVETEQGIDGTLETLIKSSKQKMKEMNQIISRATSSVTSGFTTKQLIERSLSSLERDEQKQLNVAQQESEVEKTEDDILRMVMEESKMAKQEEPVQSAPTYDIYNQLINLGFPMEVALQAQMKFQRTPKVDIEEVLQYVYQNIIY